MDLTVPQPVMLHSVPRSERETRSEKEREGAKGEHSLGKDGWFVLLVLVVFVVCSLFLFGGGGAGEVVEKI